MTSKKISPKREEYLKEAEAAAAPARQIGVQGGCAAPPGINPLGLRGGNSPIMGGASPKARTSGDGAA